MEKQKNVPILRFHEFLKVWELHKIRDIAGVTSGATPTSTKAEFWNGKIRWMNSGELNLKRVYEVHNRITELGLKSSSTKVLPKHCILIGLAGQGKTRGTVAMNMVELCTNQSVAAIYPNNDSYVPDFLFHNLDFRYQELRGLSTGDGGRGGLNLQIIKSLDVRLPSIPEQQKIASFLTAVDAKIQQLTKKKTLLDQYKKGVMQQLFRQKLRFKDEQGNAFPDWNSRLLGEISTISTGSSNRQDSSLEGAYTFFDRSQDIRSSSMYLFDGEAIIVAGEGQEFIPKYFSGKFDLHQRTYAIMNFTEIHGVYLFYYLHYHRNYFLAQAVGSTVKSLRLPMFTKMPIEVPSLSEQIKIANFLSAIDVKIEEVNQQIEKTKQFKKGLLQQMFV